MSSGRIKKTAAKAIAEGDNEALKIALTPRQEAFVREYINDFNASRAAVAAGYKDSPYINRVGSELLRKPAVRGAINLALAERNKTVDVDINYVLKKITRAIEKAEIANKYGDVLRGAELLAKYLGMFSEKIELTGKDGEAIKIEKQNEDAESLARAIASLSKRGRADGVADETQH